jgi:hypothetical protein
MRRSRRLAPVVLALLGLLVFAPVASAGLFEDLFKDFAKDGKLNACKYSESDLRKVKNLVPNDIEQYAPDFPDELDAAIERRASGACGGGGGGGGGTGGGAAPSGGGDAGTPAPPAPRETPGVPQAPPAPGAQPTPSPGVADSAIAEAARGDSGDDGAPAALIALAIVAVLAALGGALYGLARWWAWEPAWLVRLRHATAEAGWRASSTWAEFTDFVRFGR